MDDEKKNIFDYLPGFFYDIAIGICVIIESIKNFLCEFVEYYDEK